MNKTEIPPLMTGPEVAAVMKVKPGTVRTWILRAAREQSHTEFPQPHFKLGGAWMWRRSAVMRFVANRDAN